MMIMCESAWWSLYWQFSSMLHIYTWSDTWCTTVYVVYTSTQVKHDNCILTFSIISLWCILLKKSALSFLASQELQYVSCYYHHWGQTLMISLASGSWVPTWRWKTRTRGRSSRSRVMRSELMTGPWNDRIAMAMSWSEKISVWHLLLVCHKYQLSCQSLHLLRIVCKSLSFVLYLQSSWMDVIMHLTI